MTTYNLTSMSLIAADGAEHKLPIRAIDVAFEPSETVVSVWHAPPQVEEM